MYDCPSGPQPLPRQLLDLADTLEILDLSGNQLTALPNELAHFPQLRILFASCNPFTELPRVLGQCPQLEMVGFKACQIQHVPADSLPPRLRWLILTDNQISQLPDSLGQRPRLQSSCSRATSCMHCPICLAARVWSCCASPATASPHCQTACSRCLHWPGLQWQATP